MEADGVPHQIKLALQFVGDDALVLLIPVDDKKPLAISSHQIAIEPDASAQAQICIDNEADTGSQPEPGKQLRGEWKVSLSTEETRCATNLSVPYFSLASQWFVSDPNLAFRGIPRSRFLH